jgi:hypothetical protein
MWAAAIGAALSYVGGEKSKKDARRDNQATNAAEAMYNRQQSEFDAEQNYYYQQLEKQSKMRGLDEFRKFSTVQNYMPDYHNDNPGPVLPEKPEFNEGKYAPPPEKKKEKFSWTKKLTQPFYRVGQFE